tara:strand:+ start:39 stop:572 length:534 start_codon:yes stop_codon:yes gene_type:complete
MKFFTLLFFLVFFLNSCGIYQPSDARKVSPNPNERVKQNIEEGKGFRLSNLGKKGGDFLFASSNPMWRASMEKLSFAPLSVVDYSGGIIITDWFSENTEEEIKIAIRFLSNEIRADGINVIIHKKKCQSLNNCITREVKNSTNNEIRLAILKRAAEIEKKDIALAKDKSGKYNGPKN